MSIDLNCSPFQPFLYPCNQNIQWHEWYDSYDAHICRYVKHSWAIMLLASFCSHWFRNSLGLQLALKKWQWTHSTCPQATAMAESHGFARTWIFLLCYYTLLGKWNFDEFCWLWLQVLYMTDWWTWEIGKRFALLHPIAVLLFGAAHKLEPPDLTLLMGYSMILALHIDTYHLYFT